MSLLAVENLSVAFKTREGVVNAVNGVSFKLEQGRTLAIVGESGSGKSQTVFAIMGLLASNGIARGSVKFEGQEILNAPAREMNKLRAKQMAMVFQDPMTSLNPYLKVGEQLSEVLKVHEGKSQKEALTASVQMLDAVKIPQASSCVQRYPHELSGGMRQRVMIAMALLCRPKLLIADEATTALDVTVQAQILRLLAELQQSLNTAILLITHDMGVVAGASQDTLVLYGGQVMECAPTTKLFDSPSHPYTRGLLAAIPRLDHRESRLQAIKGEPPNMLQAPQGCPFAERCAYAVAHCEKATPVLSTFDANRERACHIPVEALR